MLEMFYLEIFSQQDLSEVNNNNFTSALVSLNSYNIQQCFVQLRLIHV